MPKISNLSVVDGIRCIQAVITAAGPIGVREVGRRLAFEPTRAHRLLKSLASSGMLSQDDRGRYFSGPGLHVFAAQALHASGLLPAAIPAVDRLRDLKMIVAVGMLWQTQVTYLIHKDKDRPLSAAIGSQGPFPASRSGVGLALLACQEDHIVKTLYPNRSNIPGFDSGIKELLIALRLARARGYATALQGTENGREIWSVGVVLPHVKDAAIAVSGAMRTQRHDGVAVRLLAAADEIKPQFGKASR